MRLASPDRADHDLNFMIGESGRARGARGARGRVRRRGTCRRRRRPSARYSAKRRRTSSMAAPSGNRSRVTSWSSWSAPTGCQYTPSAVTVTSGTSVSTVSVDAARRRPAAGERPDDLVLAGDAEARRGSAWKRLERRRSPRSAARWRRPGPGSPRRGRSGCPSTARVPGAPAAVRVVRPRRSAESRLICRVSRVPVHPAQRLQPAAAEQHPVGEQRGGQHGGAGGDEVVEVGQQERLAAGEDQLARLRRRPPRRRAGATRSRPRAASWRLRRGPDAAVVAGEVAVEVGVQPQPGAGHLVRGELGDRVGAAAAAYRGDGRRSTATSSLPVRAHHAATVGAGRRRRRRAAPRPCRAARPPRRPARPGRRTTAGFTIAARSPAPRRPRTGTA